MTPDPAVVAAMAPALERVRALQATPLGVILDTPLPRSGGRRVAARQSCSPTRCAKATGADVAINNNVRGGLRADLPEGAAHVRPPVRRVPVRQPAPELTLSGAELEAVIADEVRRNRPGALGISGVHVRARCSADRSRGVVGPSIRRTDRRRRAAGRGRDGLARARRRICIGAAPDGFRVPPDAPVMREVVEDWLRRRGGHLDAETVRESQYTRWDYSAADLTGCVE